MKKESFEMLARLDASLNAILRNSNKDNHLVDCDELEKKVKVCIEAPNLCAPIQHVVELGNGFYNGLIPISYLHELAYREDIAMVHFKHLHSLH